MPRPPGIAERQVPLQHTTKTSPPQGRPAELQNGAPPPEEPLAWQALLKQEEPAGQMLPQKPQFDGSEVVSRQEPPQHPRPRSRQTAPQAPQLFGSCNRFVQNPPVAV